jgi:peptidoglycan/xylan/chitin deacetylase (PgdA/CDA1 family)
VPAQAARPPLRIPILMYHRIDVVRPTLPAITQRLTVDPGRFAAQMEWLHAHGYHALTETQLYDALERGAPLPRRPVVITFDDGYRDVLWKAAPVLKRLHMHATAFVITDRISAGDVSFLTWPLLKVLERQGVEIGSHTVSHLDLTTLSGAQLQHELVDSRATLEQRLGHPVRWFAYPAGRFDARVVAAARAAGYELAMTTQPGSLQDPAQPLELHRYEILDDASVATVAADVGG